MSTIQIGAEERPLQNADPEWITQSIGGRRHNGLAVCVRVRIKTGDLDFSLATPACGGGVGGRAPIGKEIPILNRWSNLGLNDSNFSPGNVVAFLKGLPSLL